jgi:large subunit ribosomal protein L24e
LQDATFELERKRNRPERYDRNVVEQTVKAMKKISEVREKRESRFWEKR